MTTLTDGFREQYRDILPVLKYRKMVFERGKGSYLYDLSGRRYLDLNSGQFCGTFGHSDPGIKVLFQEILETLQDTDTSSISKPLLKSAALLREISGNMSARSLLLSTGAEANECALKYAKFLKKRNGIVSFSRGYHGLTHGTAAYSMSRDKIRPSLGLSFELRTPTSFPQSIDPDEEEILNELENILLINGEDIAAVLMEPIISGGGLLFPTKSFFSRVSELCKRFDVYLILDECQTGVARTGQWFDFQNLEIIPDMLVTAKALGAGFPVAALLMNSESISNEEFEMKYFSSHQNEPFSAQIVTYVIERIMKDDLLKRNLHIGEDIRKGLREIELSSEVIQNVRGRGMIMGFDLFQTNKVSSQEMGDTFVELCENEGLLLQHCNYGKTIRLLPNYCVSDQEIAEFLDKLNAVCSKIVCN